MSTTTTPAGLRNYKRVMPTKFMGKCAVCEAVTRPGIDFAAVNGEGKWIAICAPCSASVAAQVQRTLPLLEADAATLTEDQQGLLPLPSEGDVVRALSGEAEGLALDVLASLRASRSMAQGMAGITPAVAVRTNSYDGTCALCANGVVAKAGRIEKVNGRWVTYHLDGQCPPKLENAPKAPRNIPAGRYAVPSATGNNDLDFFEIDHGKGKWSGYIFAARIIGGHEPIRLDKRQSAAALSAIEAIGPDVAMSMYGIAIGKCGKCHLPLTDEASRARGIGPVCAANLGW